MQLFKHLILGAIIFLTGINTVFASARMTVPIKERVSLEMQGQQTAVQIKWIILDHEQNIIKVSSGKYFGHIFETAGLYTVNVELNNTDTNNVSYTTVEILVGDSKQNFDQSTSDGQGQEPIIENSIKTSPPTDASDVIHLPAQGGEVSYFVFPGDNLKSFSIDKDLSKDSDLDLDPSNDTDNLNSLLLQPYTVFYEAQAQPYKAKALALSLNNQTLSKTFTIVFDGMVNENQAPVLILQSSPAADPGDQKIHISGERADVSFDLSASTGNISEYRIDSNIFVDSDGNGVPDDDIDNLNDLSLHKGTPFTINYVKSSQKIIAQLTVLDKNGKGSRIQKEILFTKEVSFKADFSTREPMLYAKQIVHFQNQTTNPLALDLNYGWDFNGDKKIEIVSKEQIVEYTFPEPGKYPVTLYVRDPEGNVTQLVKTLLVNATGLGELPEDLLPGEGRIQATIADFDLQITNFTVQFSDLSQVSPDLIDGTLQYQWFFGDNQTSQEQNPIHEYQLEGSYIVELKITDTAQNIARKRLEIHVPSLGNVIANETGTGAVLPIINGDETGESGSGFTLPSDQIAPSDGESMFWWIIKIIAWILLGIILLIILILGGGLLYIKMQHPDFSLLDAWEELKELINEKLQGTRAIPMDKASNQPTAPATPAKILPAANIIETKENVKTPSWLKTEATSSTQAEKKESAPEKKKVDAPKLSSDEIPDWLKPKPAPKESKESSDDDDWLLKDDEDFDIEDSTPKSPEVPKAKEPPKPEAPKTPKVIETEKKPNPPVKSEVPKDTKREEPTKKVTPSTPTPNKAAEKPEAPKLVVPNPPRPNTPPPVRNTTKPEAPKPPTNTLQTSPVQTPPPPVNTAPQPSPKPASTLPPPPAARPKEEPKLPVTPAPLQAPETKPKEEPKPPVTLPPVQPPAIKPKEEPKPPLNPAPVQPPAIKPKEEPKPPLNPAPVQPPAIKPKEEPKTPSPSGPEYLDIPKAEE